MKNSRADMFCPIVSHSKSVRLNPYIFFLSENFSWSLALKLVSFDIKTHLFSNFNSFQSVNALFITSSSLPILIRLFLSCDLLTCLTSIKYGNEFLQFSSSNTFYCTLLNRIMEFFCIFISIYKYLKPNQVPASVL
jgi:hypothetical protein